MVPGKPGKIRPRKIHRILENGTKLGKTGWALKVPPTPRFGGPSIQLKNIFPKKKNKFQLCFPPHKYYLPNISSLTMLGIFLIFHLIFIPLMYILAQAMNNLVYKECKGRKNIFPYMITPLKDV